MSDISTWMPMYWSDYRAKTHHLSLEEHGAYCLLLSVYWERGGPLPDDDKRLAQSISATPVQWKRMRPALAPFFQIADGLWTHARVEEEIVKAKRNVEFNKNRTASATLARKLKREQERLARLNDERGIERDVHRDVNREYALNVHPHAGDGSLPVEGNSDGSVDGTDPTWEDAA